MFKNPRYIFLLQKKIFLAIKKKFWIASLDWYIFAPKWCIRLKKRGNNKNIKFNEIRRNLTSVWHNSGYKFESCQFKFEFFTPDSHQIRSNCTQLHQIQHECLHIDRIYQLQTFGTQFDANSMSCIINAWSQIARNQSILFHTP